MCFQISGFTTVPLAIIYRWRLGGGGGKGFATGTGTGTGTGLTTGLGGGSGLATGLGGGSGLTTGLGGGSGLATGTGTGTGLTTGTGTTTGFGCGRRWANAPSVMPPTMAAVNKILFIITSLWFVFYRSLTNKRFISLNIVYNIEIKLSFSGFLF